MKESAEVAVGRLFEEHGARLYRLGVRFCGNADEAQDLVQDVFLQAFRSWKQFDGRSSPSTWLYTIAARRCQRRHRRRAGEPASMTSLSSLVPSARNSIAQNAPDPFDDAAREQLQDRVAAAVAQLPPGIRLPLVLAEIAEIPLKDVAQVLGLKLGTVKSRVHRARVAIRDLVAADQPSRVTPADHGGRFCLDLLRAKQEALDRGVSFVVKDADLCERCRGVLAALDLTRDACRRLAHGEMPVEVAALTRARLTPRPLRNAAGRSPRK